MAEVPDKLDSILATCTVLQLQALLRPLKNETPKDIRLSGNKTELIQSVIKSVQADRLPLACVQNAVRSSEDLAVKTYSFSTLLMLLLMSMKRGKGFLGPILGKKILSFRCFFLTLISNILAAMPGLTSVRTMKAVKRVGSPNTTATLDVARSCPKALKPTILRSSDLSKSG